jgi:hypothetical protein
MLLIKYENDVVPHSSICLASGMTVREFYNMDEEEDTMVVEEYVLPSVDQRFLSP